MRLSYPKVSPGAYQAMLAVEAYLATTGLDPALLHLVKLRASQLNGCAYCIDMHWKDARALGEPEDRLYMLNAWRESPRYSDRERAALALAEAMTHLDAREGVPDAVFDAARQHVSERELVDLCLAISMINAWNRMGVTFKPTPGTYRPKRTEPAPA
jgi:AhpD family alkylhydroperoxidase